MKKYLYNQIINLIFAGVVVSLIRIPVITSRVKQSISFIINGLLRDIALAMT